MASFNQVTLLGHLTRDPQIKPLPGGSSVVEFGVAVNRKYKTAGGEQRQEVTFVDCAAFGKQGEVIGKYLTKGKPIFLTGRLKLDSWEKDGQKRSKISVVVEQFQFVGAREGGVSGGGAPGGAQGEQPFGNEEQFKDGDIPF